MRPTRRLLSADMPSLVFVACRFFAQQDFRPASTLCCMRQTRRSASPRAPGTVSGALTPSPVSWHCESERPDPDKGKPEIDRKPLGCTKHRAKAATSIAYFKCCGKPSVVRTERCAPGLPGSIPVSSPLAQIFLNWAAFRNVNTWRCRLVMLAMLPIQSILQNCRVCSCVSVRGTLDSSTNFGSRKRLAVSGRSEPPFLVSDSKVMSPRN